MGQRTRAVRPEVYGPGRALLRWEQRDLANLHRNLTTTKR